MQVIMIIAILKYKNLKPINEIINACTIHFFRRQKTKSQIKTINKKKQSYFFQYAFVCVFLTQHNPQKLCNLYFDKKGFTLFVFLVSCDCYCSVVLPHYDVGWSAVCDCGIS